MDGASFLESDKLSSSPAFPTMPYSQDMVRSQGTGKAKGAKKRHVGEVEPTGLAEVLGWLWSRNSSPSLGLHTLSEPDP